MLNKFLHARVKITIENFIELSYTFGGVVCNRKDVTVLSENLIGVIDLTDDELIDGHSSLICLKSNLTSDLH